MNLSFDINAFLATIPIMAKGMLGIFVVTLIIIAVMIILNKLASSEKKDN